MIPRGLRDDRDAYALKTIWMRSCRCGSRLHLYRSADSLERLGCTSDVRSNGEAGGGSIDFILAAPRSTRSSPASTTARRNMHRGKMIDKGFQFVTIAPCPPDGGQGDRGDRQDEAATAAGRRKAAAEARTDVHTILILGRIHEAVLDPARPSRASALRSCPSGRMTILALGPRADRHHLAHHQAVGSRDRLCAS